MAGSFRLSNSLPSAALQGGKTGGQARGSGGVGIHVGAGILSRLASGVDARDRLRHLRPISAAAGLQMINLDRNATLASDGQRLVDPLQQPVGFRAHVRNVDAAERRHGLSHFRQFVRAGVIAGWINQGRADTECAVAHRLAHQRLHLFDLSGRGVALLHALDVLADRGGADEGAEVCQRALSPRSHAARRRIHAVRRSGWRMRYGPGFASTQSSSRSPAPGSSLRP